MGFYPHDLLLYRVALMHRSTTSTNRQMRHINNERLEFLGDAILGAVVADIVYDRYRNQQEGFLTTLRSKIVKRETLNELAVKIGLDKLVIHSDRMAASHNNYMNGNAFEAFMGAMYLDRGYDYCMYFIKERILGRYIDIDKMSHKEENYKSKIIEWCQHYQCQFEFVITAEKVESGNTPKFYAEVRVEDMVCGKGTGYSKKESHQNAAQQAFKKVQSDVKFVNSIMDKRNQRINGNAETPKQQSVEKKPVEQQPTEKPAEKKSVEKKPVEKKKEVKQQQVSEQQPTEKPAEKKPVEKKSVEKKPVERKKKEVKKEVKQQVLEQQPTEKESPKQTTRKRRSRSTKQAEESDVAPQTQDKKVAKE